MLVKRSRNYHFPLDNSGDVIKVIKEGAPLAQLVEQLTLNQRVGGSNPSRGTFYFTPHLLAVGESVSHKDDLVPLVQQG